MRSGRSESAIAGAGFIGAVHARSARLAGAQLVGVSASSPARAEQAAAELGAERAFASSEELVAADDVDVVHICTPNHLHLPLAEAALAAGKHVICEKPLALDAAGARRLVDAAAAAGPPPRCRSSTATTRRSARRASASAPARTGPLRLAARHLPAGLAAAPGGRQLARRRRARRRLARLRRHRLALVRPRRVRLRPPHRPPQRPHADRGARAPHARRPPGVRAAATATASCARSRTEDAAVVQFETDGGALGTDGHQPDLGRAQEPPLARGRRRRGGARLRPGGAGDAVGRAAARPRRSCAATREHLSPRRRAARDAARRATRRATPTASTCSSTTSTPAIRGEARRRRAAVRRRPARRADHRRGARLRARAALGRRRRAEPVESRMSTPPVLEVRGLVKEYPGVRALQGVDFDVLRGRGPLPARPQRRRQVDADQVRLRRGRADRRRDPRRRRAAAGRRPRARRSRRRRDDLPGARPRRGPDRRREHLPRPRAAPRPAARPRRR